MFIYHMQFFQKILVTTMCWCNSIFWKFLSLLFVSIFIQYDAKNCSVCSVGMFYTTLFSQSFSRMFFNNLARVPNFQHSSSLILLHLASSILQISFVNISAIISSLLQYFNTMFRSTMMLGVLCHCNRWLFIFKNRHWIHRVFVYIH